jgi:hypothetical protein
MYSGLDLDPNAIKKTMHPRKLAIHLDNIISFLTLVIGLQTFFSVKVIVTSTKQSPKASQVRSVHGRETADKTKSFKPLPFTLVNLQL